jgi:hypothetical protein
MGKVQYFTYPNNDAGNGNTKALDMSELDRIEQHIHQSAHDFSQQNNVQGLEGGTEFIDGVNY